MNSLWQIPFTIENEVLIVKSLKIETILDTKEIMEIDLTEQLKKKKIKIDWVEVNLNNKVILIPHDETLYQEIIKIESLCYEENPPKKFKINEPTAAEKLKYGY